MDEQGGSSRAAQPPSVIATTGSPLSGGTSACGSVQDTSPARVIFMRELDLEASGQVAAQPA